METFANTLLVSGFLGILHSYVMYPLFWMVFRPQNGKAHLIETETAPTKKVSVVISAFNEQSHIERRILNLFDTDYPSKLLEIIIASDGSTDETTRIVRGQSAPGMQLRLLDYPNRRGKVNVLNEACRQATGDILVFSDANVDFHPSAIRQLVRAMEAPNVGCVCGRLRFRVKSGVPHEESEGLYWALETWLKKHEGNAGCLLGANGAIYAMPRKLWEDCPPDTIIDDFFIPMRLMMKGWKTIYAPDALAEEDLPPKATDEFGRRIRIGAGNFQTLMRCLPMLNPARGLSAWAFFSHKVLRWLGPFFMIFILVGSALQSLRGEAWAMLLIIAQFIFYGAAWAGLQQQQSHRRSSKLAGVAFHFVSMNLALLLGFFRWINGSQQAAWNRTQR